MISILDENFSTLNNFLTYLQPTQIFILVDEHTHEYCLPILLGNLETEIPFEIIEIEAGEDLKTIETATQLWEILAEFSADRKSLLINLGGGVITDLGGFVASTYKRGIPFVNIPTTLLAMCDASLGGKTGIDHLFLKNIVGTFSSAEEVFVYPGFLTTLPFTELRSGFAEMLKHGLIADEMHWTKLTAVTKLSPENVAPHIETSMNIKQNVVEQDFREEHVRKILNFGHTVGHAVESLFLQKGQILPHGEAVALGMICETYLSFLENLITEKTADQVITEIRKFFPHVSISGWDTAEILSLMRNDKKNAAGKINFSLLTDIGKSKFNCQVEEKHINYALHYYQNLT
ncbi:3-dehydroquinate synthase [Kaistella palustris]|uniref:3-dehydroquinate synthase n=1 Tax=Kaistella palustris TaxID=493376 RepID=UPI00041D3709|nr:3-dehydroquinate synthase [Kaistella palustris]